MDEMLIKQIIFCIKENTMTIDNIVDNALRVEVEKRLK